MHINRNPTPHNLLKTAAILGIFCLQGCGGKGISQTTISIDSKDIDDIKSIFRGAGGPYPNLTIRVWRYNTDNKTIAEVYTPDGSGQVIIPLQSGTLSWGWGIRVGDSRDYPIPVAVIATHFDQPVLAARRILDEDERAYYFRNYGPERPDPGYSFNWAALTLTGVSVPTPSVVVQNQFGGLGHADMLPVSANNSVEIQLYSQPDQYGSLGPFIWASESTSAGEPTRYGFIPHPGYVSSNSFTALTLNLDYQYASIPWEIISNNTTPSEGVISINGDQSGRMATAKIPGDNRQGKIAVPTQLPETDYTLTYDYTAGLGACKLTEKYGKTLPQKINLNLEPLGILDANLDLVNNRVDWQVEQNATAEVELFLSQSYLWQWLATAPSSLKSWNLPRLPKEIITSSELKTLNVLSHPFNLTVHPKKISGLDSISSTYCRLLMAN